MNLSGFLKQVDEICSKKSREELSQFVHEVARKLPSEKREDFLDDLRSVGASPQLLKSIAGKGFQERCDAIVAELMRIEEAELMLESELNENYDDWYHDDEEEFVFTDPQGIGRIIETACEFLYDCEDHEEYDFGAEVAGTLLNLEIFDHGEYNDCVGETLSLGEIVEKGLAGIDMKKTLLCALYLEYFASDKEEKPEALYSIFSEYARYGVTLEQLMQYGKELPDFQEFLCDWISWLGVRTDRLAQKLLNEAVELMDDEDILLESARKYVGTHPGLYEKYMMNKSAGAATSRDAKERLYAIGQEALSAIDTSYTVRSRIALLNMEIAEDLGWVDDEERCMVEVFRSDSTLANYLRIRLTSHDYSKYEMEITGICKAFYMKEGGLRQAYDNGELTKNEIGSNTAYMLAFLEGDFDTVLRKGMNTKEALGWSSTFMKCGLAAFLLLLLESESLTIGARKMCGTVMEYAGHLQFDHSGKRKDAQDAAGEFWKLFSLWKKTVNVSKEQKSRWLERMEELIDRRVEGIMSANRRNYYDECAAYVAALGEVKESAGEPGGKQKVMEQYRMKYSRRSAFHQALRAHGMRGK
ncbi:MAG: hypothetical protein LUG99_14675 [Lachnospiraceae bacterium]|nr:hypothetical protein [Lachnospiraceae bacterium]